MRAVKMVDFLINRSFRSGQHGRADCLAPFSALLKRTAAITQAGLGSQTIRSGIVAFKTLPCVIEVAYVFAALKAITVNFSVWEKTTRKELQPFELQAK